MHNRLADAITSSRADYTEIRLERSWLTAVAYRGSRLEGANSSLDLGGFVRCMSRGYGWGAVSFNGLDHLDAMVARAHELSLAVRLDQPIRLAELPARRDDVRAELDGDVRGISLAEKQQLLERLNQEMLAVDRRIVDTQAAYRDEVTEYWFANSDGTMADPNAEEDDRERAVLRCGDRCHQLVGGLFGKTVQLDQSLRAE